jgi:IS5 family transposase
MEVVVPWGSLCALIEPHYPSGERRSPPIGIERMLRITFPQHWFNMSDQQAEDSLYDSASKKGWGPIKIKENLTRVFLTAKIDAVDP